MSLEVHLRIVGLSLIALALLHTAMPRRFNWRAELQSVTLLTRQMFYGHVFFIALMCWMIGLLAVLNARDLIQPSGLGRTITTGLAAFWALRLGFQFFYYDSALWRGHRFNTVMHICFSALWFYYAVVFGMAAMRQW